MRNQVKRLSIILSLLIPALLLHGCSSQKNDTDRLKQAIDSVSSFHSLHYEINYEQILQSDTGTHTTISTTENKRTREPFVMWTKSRIQINTEPQQLLELYLKSVGNSMETSTRTEGTEWSENPIMDDPDQIQKLINYYESFINASFYLLAANLESFQLEENQGGLIKYGGTISQSSVLETYKLYLRESYIDTNLLTPEKENPNDLRNEITSGKVYELMAGIPSLAFTDQPIPISVWVNEESNKISKVEINKIDVIQAILDKNMMGEKVKQQRLKKPS